jgi:hypothetical protein
MILKVGAKFVNPWYNKIMMGQIILLNFFRIFKNKRWVQSLLARGPKKPCLVRFCFVCTFFSSMIHDDCTCQNEKNEESGERKN